MKTRSIWLIISLLLIGCLLLTACGNKSEATVAGGDYLTINYEQVSTWVRNFNPFSANALGSTATAIYEPMMIYNKSTGELVPWLATEYTWSEDNLTLTFTIRPNVKWSDGEPFTANDVVYTYDLLKNNEALTGTATSVLSEYIASYSALDDLTVEFKFTSVYTPALYDIANQVIIPEHIWKDVADPLTWTNESPVAIGSDAGLAFLGFENVNVVSWGTMLYWASNSSALLQEAWWTFLPPGLCIALVSFATTMLIYAMDELTNPRLRSEKEITRVLKKYHITSRRSTPVLHEPIE